MAVKPIIKPVTPFDANDGVRLVATYSGNQPFYNRVVIQDASTLMTVYARTVETRACEHYVDPSYKGAVVDAGDTGYALINGRRYTATIQFFERDMTPGLVSDKATFLTRSTPQFYFEGLMPGDTIKNSSIQLNLVYSQHEYEQLLSYRFYIYDNMKELLQQTEIFYDTSDLSYTFKGLENTEQYYVRAEGITVNGIALDTGYYGIYVWYDNPNMYARMYVDNDINTSGMEYFTNFKLIESDEDPESFDYRDGWIDICGKRLTYSTNFKIEGDATWFIRVKDMDREGDILACHNGDEEFTLTSMKNDAGKYVFKLIVPNGMMNYVLYSGEYYIAYSDIINIWIRRINNIYEMKVFYEEIDEYNNYYFMANEPIDSGDMDKYDLWVDVNQNPGYKVYKNNELIFYQKAEPVNVDNGNIWVGGDE